MSLGSQPRIIGSGSYISAIAAAFFLLLPLSIGAAAENESFSESALGALATIYLIAFTITGIGVASLMAKVKDKHLTLLGYGILALGFLLASYSIARIRLWLEAFCRTGHCCHIVLLFIIPGLEL